MTALAWVTTASARGRDDDEPLGLAALARAGVDVDVVDWDDPGVDWARFDRVAVRSTWDYPQRLDAFLAWLQAVEAVTRLANPVALMAWNIDKRYLVDLAADGVAVVPTTVLDPGREPDLGGEGFVVKPAIGAGSQDVAVYAPAERRRAQAHVERLHARGATALVQPLLPAVATDGEWPLVFFAGRFSHAANKRVELPGEGEDDLFAPETTAQHVADEAQLAVAETALAAIGARFGTPAYARVDLVRDGDGYRVLEVELIEPSLFLPQAGPAAADRLAEALVR